MLNWVTPKAKNRAVNPKSTTISIHISPTVAPLNITALKASFT